MKRKKKEAKKYCKICKKKIRWIQRILSSFKNDEIGLNKYHRSCYIDYWENPSDENSSEKRFAKLVGVKI